MEREADRMEESMNGRARRSSSRDSPAAAVHREEAVAGRRPVEVRTENSVDRVAAVASSRRGGWASSSASEGGGGDAGKPKPPPGDWAAGVSAEVCGLRCGGDPGGGVRGGGAPSSPASSTLTSAR